jgi:hypothetical protein
MRQVRYGTVVDADSSYLHVVDASGEHYYLSYHLGVTADASRELGASVKLVWHDTASGGWWVATSMGSEGTGHGITR